MNDDIARVVEEQARLWSGVAVPNTQARDMAAALEAVLKGFEALRGSLQFEDEPSSFEAALQETKE
jgi:hypothetical protein